MQLEKLIVPLVMDRSGYDKGIEGAKDGAGGLVSGLAAIGGGIVTAGIAAAGVGLVALGAGLSDATKGAMDAQNIQADLNATLKSTGGIAGMTAGSVNLLAGALSRVTPFEDDVIVSGENMLLTFTNIGKDVFPQATESILNMSTKMGTDLKSSAIQLGKALNDPTQGISALTRVGVTFTDEQKAMIKAMQDSGDIAGAQTVILAELEKEFGGVARAAGATAEGGMIRFQNQLNNFKDEIGTALLPALGSLTNQLADTFSKPEVQAGVTALAKGLGDFASYAVTELPVAIEYFKILVEWLSNVYDKGYVVFTTLSPIIQTWVDNTILLFQGFWALVNGDFETAGEKLGQILSNDFDLLDTITKGRLSSWKDVWNFGFDDLILLMSNSKDWTDVGKKIVELIKTGFSFGLDDLWNTISSFLSKIASDIQKFISGLSAGFNVEVKNTPQPPQPPQPPKPTQPPPPKGRANGGLADGLTWVGERGPELLDLPSGSMVYSNSDSKRMTSGIDTEKLITEIRKNNIDYNKLARAIRDNMLLA